MATNEENLNLIAEIEKEIIDNEQFTLQEYKEQIILLETAKERFQEPAAILDRALYKQVAEVNNKRDELSNAYQDRLENECKTDLFWRYVGFSSYLDAVDELVYYRYKLRCERLSTYFNSEDINPGTVTIAESWDNISGLTTTSYSLEEVAGGKLKISNSFAGVAELENRDGLKLYTEPYTKDLIDTFVAESYGIISLDSNKITLLSPFEGDINNIEGDNIVTCEPNPFNPELSATVVSIATTSIDLGGFNTTITGGINTSTAVPYITVDETSNLDLTQLPLDGSTPYPLFQFSVSPNEIDEEDFSVDFETSPYVPQTIKILEFESIEKANQKINGDGIRIQRTNNGYDTKTAKWDPFLEGFPNPNNLKVTVEEPLVSAGQQFYVLGFDKKPRKWWTQNGNDAVEGDEYEIDTGDPFGTYPSNNSPYNNYPLYRNLSSCPPALDNAISDAITAKDNAVSAWNNTNNNVSARITLSNLLKDEINYINLRIWSLRMQLGESKKTIKTKEDFNEEIIKSGLLDLLNNPDEL